MYSSLVWAVSLVPFCVILSVPISINRTKIFHSGTLAVNVIGCFVIGFLTHLAETHGMFEENTRNFMFVGILGGFTTFSSFGNETVKLARDNQMLNAFANVGANVILGLVAVWFGRALAAAIWR